jgi:hypothetical protein
MCIASTKAMVEILLSDGSKRDHRVGIEEHRSKNNFHPVHRNHRDWISTQRGIANGDESSPRLASTSEIKGFEGGRGWRAGYVHHLRVMARAQLTSLPLARFTMYKQGKK